jgi:hypothetical protein
LNHIGNENIETIKNLLKNNATNLDLCNLNILSYIALNHIGYNGAKDIGRALKNDTSLIILNLSNSYHQYYR